MKIRVAVTLVAVLLLLGLVAYLADRAEEQRYSTAAAGKLVPGLEPGKVAKLEVKSTDGTTLLEKKEGAWKVAPEGFSADETAVKDALEKLAKLEKRTVASESPAKHELLEVKEGDPKTTEVTVWVEGRAEPVAHLFVGKNGGDLQSSFVRLKGEDRVYQTQEALRPAFDRGARGWRDRTVLKVAPDEVTRIELTSAAGHAVLEREAKEGAPWKLIEPAPGPAKPQAVEAILRSSENLQAEGFAAAADPATTGLDAPEARVKLTLKDNRSFELLFGKDGGAGKVYAKRADTDTVYELQAYRKTSLLPAPESLVEVPAPSAAASPAPTATP